MVHPYALNVWLTFDEAGEALAPTEDQIKHWQLFVRKLAIDKKVPQLPEGQPPYGRISRKRLVAYCVKNGIPLGKLDPNWAPESFAIGDPERPNFGLLLEAMRQFWSTYDRDDPSTAPKQADVIDWCEKRGATKHAAKAIDLLARPKSAATRGRTPNLIARPKLAKTRGRAPKP